MTEQTERTVPWLMARYRLRSRPALYSRLKGVGIRLQREPDGITRASQEQVPTLDRLDAHIRAGGAIADFPEAERTDRTNGHGEHTEPEPMPYGKAEIVRLHEPPPEENGIILDLLAAIAQNVRPREVVGAHRQLEEAADRGWILSSSEVQQLLGIRPRGDCYQRGGWLFVRAGKVGRESGWQVERSQ